MLEKSNKQGSDTTKKRNKKGYKGVRKDKKSEDDKKSHKNQPKGDAKIRLKGPRQWRPEGDKKV